MTIKFDFSTIVGFISIIHLLLFGDIIWSNAYDVVIYIPIWISDTVPKTGQSSENMTCADNGDQ